MSLLVPRAPVQDGPSPTAQQDLHTTCITTLRSREARCSKLLGEAAFSCLVRTAKTGCGQKKVTFCGVSLQSCLFVHSQCFYLLEALLSRATVPGISTHADFFFFPAAELPRSDLQTKMRASHLSCHPVCLRITSILQLPALSITPWHRATGLEIISQQRGWQRPSLIKHNLLSCTNAGPAALPGLKRCWLVFFFVREMKKPKSEGSRSGEKSPSGQGTQSLAIHSRSYISLQLMNKLINYTRNHRQHRRNIHLRAGYLRCNDN